LISLKKYLSADTQQEELVRVVQELQEGMMLHAVRGEEQEYRRLCLDAQRTNVHLGDNPPLSDLQASAKAALKSLQEYNLKNTRSSQAQAKELQAIVSMLAEAVTVISAGSDQSIKRLHHIEKKLETVAGLEDMRVLKIHLSDCLGDVREESLRQRQQATRNVEALREGLRTHETGSADAPAAPAKDSVTGLPGPEQAQASLTKLCAAEPARFAALFVVDDVHSLNARYGHKVGDECLVLVARHLAQRLPADKLYRWRGPTLLAIVEREAPIEELQKQLRQIASAKLEKTIHLNERVVRLLISFSWTLFPLHDQKAPETLFQNLDVFAGTVG
jgi:diguanylate cyclase (GGDEF)-like protein